MTKKTKTIITGLIAFLLGVSVAFNIFLMCGGSIDIPMNGRRHSPINGHF